jgi:DNA-binding transcriptional LysR family regulator
MNLQRFRYFAMVVAEGSFSRAAEKLHMSQPPLSRQIQQLEDEIGAQLLHRGRPLILTEAGRYFYEQIRQVLNRVDGIRSMTRKNCRREHQAIQHWNRGLYFIRVIAGIDPAFPPDR